GRNYCEATLAPQVLCVCPAQAGGINIMRCYRDHNGKRVSSQLRVLPWQKLVDTPVDVELIALLIDKVRVQWNSWKHSDIHSELCFVIWGRPCDRFRLIQTKGNKIDVLSGDLWKRDFVDRRNVNLVFAVLRLENQT